jgi:phenylacetate-CoA ligase
MFHHAIAQLAYSSKFPKLIPITRYLSKSQWLPWERLKERQEQDLRKLIAFVFENIPYYRNCMQSLHLKPQDIKTARDLEKLPVLSRQIIRENWEDFIRKNISRTPYIRRSTSGSTGAPFQYRWSNLDMQYSPMAKNSWLTSEPK